MTRNAWRLAAWGATVLLLVLCFLPGDDLPAEGPPGADKLVHLVAFFGTCALWRFAGFGRTSVFLIGLALAVGTELGQHLLVPGRHGDAWDALADAVGAALAALLVPARGR